MYIFNAYLLNVNDHVSVVLAHGEAHRLTHCLHAWSVATADVGWQNINRKYLQFSLKLHFIDIQSLTFPVFEEYNVGSKRWRSTV